MPSPFLARRHLLRLAAAGTGSLLAPRVVFALAATERRFVFVIQRGAADGLDTVIPYADPAYARLRGALAIDAGRRHQARRHVCAAPGAGRDGQAVQRRTGVVRARRGIALSRPFALRWPERARVGRLGTVRAEGRLAQPSARAAAQERQRGDRHHAHRAVGAARQGRGDLLRARGHAAGERRPAATRAAAVRARRATARTVVGRDGCARHGGGPRAEAEPGRDGPARGAVPGPAARSADCHARDRAAGTRTVHKRGVWPID